MVESKAPNIRKLSCSFFIAYRNYALLLPVSSFQYGDSSDGKAEPSLRYKPENQLVILAIQLLIVYLI